MNIFFDLDGTLLDSKERLFRLFCTITKQSDLQFDDYWKLKRDMFDHREILTNHLQYSLKEIELFESSWMLLIESDEFLSFDRPFLFADLVLKNLKARGHNLYVITARQNKHKAINQLERFGLALYFSEIYVTEATKTKTDLLLESGISFNETDILIGDTGIDIKTAKAIGIRSMAVLSGFRNRAALQKYLPDYIENDIQAILKYVQN